MINIGKVSSIISFTSFILQNVFVLWQQYLSCVTNINIIHIFCIRLSLAEMTFDTNTIIKLG